MICAAVFLACRVLQLPAALPVVVVAIVMLQVGAVKASSIPGLAQVADAKTALDHWSDDQVQRPSAEGRVTSDASHADSVAQDCPPKLQ